MSNIDTPVLVGWPIAWPPREGFLLQGPTNVPVQVTSSDESNPPGGLMIPVQLGLGPVFPSSGER